MQLNSARFYLKELQLQSSNCAHMPSFTSNNLAYKSGGGLVPPTTAAPKSKKNKDKDSQGEFNLTTSY